ncbi:MAG TPA: hypothetical protein VD834_13445 [Blastococcus sp.]|nr:hypothetical protein [Blastococcus sp.]
MQLRDVIGPLVQQVRVRHVGAQVVTAVPATTVVERNDERVVPLEGLQHSSAARAAGDRVAQRTAEPGGDGGLQQEKLRTSSGWHCSTSWV